MWHVVAAYKFGKGVFFTEFSEFNFVMKCGAHSVLSYETFCFVKVIQLSELSQISFQLSARAHNDAVKS